MKKLITLLILLVFTVAHAEQTKTYSLQDCINIALKNNPELLASEQQLKGSFFKIGQARSGYFPEINLTVGYERNYQEMNSIDRYSKNYTAQLVVNQNIFDFGKTSTQVKLQKQLYQATQWQDTQLKTQIVYSVKEAYFNVLKAKKQKQTAQEVLKQAQKHLELAKGFYEVGLKPKIEVTKAEVELSNAKLSLISAEKNLKQALLNLKIAMGVVDMPDFDIKDEEYGIRKIEEREALDIALQRNPELQSIKLSKAATESSEELIKKEYFPTLTGVGRWGFSGDTFPLDKGWSLIFQLNLPLFNGWATTYKLKQAKADITYYSYKEESLKQQIISQIKTFFVQLKEASQKIDTLKIALKQAEENLQLAMARYEVGVGTSIEVVDAIVLFEQTNTQYWQAVYDYNVTYAAIEKIMGI